MTYQQRPVIRGRNQYPNAMPQQVAGYQPTISQGQSVPYQTPYYSQYPGPMQKPAAPPVYDPAIVQPRYADSNPSSQNGMLDLAKMVESTKNLWNRYRENDSPFSSRWSTISDPFPSIWNFGPEHIVMKIEEEPLMKQQEPMIVSGYIPNMPPRNDFRHNAVPNPTTANSGPAPAPAQTTVMPNVYQFQPQRTSSNPHQRAPPSFKPQAMSETTYSMRTPSPGTPYNPMNNAPPSNPPGPPITVAQTGQPQVQAPPASASTNTNEQQEYEYSSRSRRQSRKNRAKRGNSGNPWFYRGE